jgi:hypothetical protein
VLAVERREDGTFLGMCSLHQQSYPLRKGVGLEDLDVTKAAGRSFKGRELVGSNLCQAAMMPIADYLGRSVCLVEARSARRSVRGGQNLSAHRVG